MIRRVAELDKIDNFIDRVGDVQLWLELVHYISLFTGGMRQFRSAVRGGSVRNQFFVSFGENGNGESHRHAKNRMHNLVTELRELKGMERKWKKENRFALSRGQALFTATSAMRYYETWCRAKGNFQRIEDDCEQFMLEISTCLAESEDYFQDGQPLVRTDMTPDQHASLRASTVAYKEQAYAHASSLQAALSRKKKRRTNSIVSFDPETYVCAEADVDILRHRASVAMQDEADPKPTTRNIPPPTSTSAPKQPYIVRPLKDYLSRNQSFNDRHSPHYKRGSWAVEYPSVIVNTSGCGMRKDDWEKYVTALEEDSANAETGGN
jgi:hypothetical protein